MGFAVLLEDGLFPHELQHLRLRDSLFREPRRELRPAAGLRQGWTLSAPVG